jgi:hypothetical protein
LFPKLIQEEVKESYDETYSMTDFKPEDENTHHSGGKKEHRQAEDDDEQEFYQGGKKMRCQHQ